jgi:hypothetical protein
MKLRKFALPIPVALAAALSFGSPASAGVSLSAVACSPLTAHASKIEYTQYGVHNSATSGGTAQVWCPGSQTQGTSPSPTVTVHAYDRDSSNTTAHQVCCTAVRLANGNPISSNTGCTAGLPNNSVQTISISLPSGAAQIAMFCDIPPATSNGFSHVTTYSIVP